MDVQAERRYQTLKRKLDALQYCQPLCKYYALILPVLCSGGLSCSGGEAVERHAQSYRGFQQAQEDQ